MEAFGRTPADSSPPQWAGAWMLVGVLGAMLQCTDADRSAPVARFRNLLLISIDTCRADHLSCYGYGRATTPNIDALARKAVVFDNAGAHASLGAAL